MRLSDLPPDTIAYLDKEGTSDITSSIISEVWFVYSPPKYMRIVEPDSTFSPGSGT